ncbi:MAG: hypothetical protein JXB10_03625 [Pirellulales bacterium]|nr:hypothetical protein [Pirellulales bacterium]
MQIAIILVFSIFLTGCISQKSSTSNAAPADARSVVERGPVKVTVTVSPAKARLSDEPVLTLTTDAAAGVKVEKTPFGERLGSFKIVKCREPLPKTRNGREIKQRIFTLEPTAVGRHVIDPIDVTFIDKRPGGDQKIQTLETKPLTVQVTSVRGEETPKLSDLRGAAAPVALPWTVPAWLGILIVLLLVGGGAAVWFTRRQRREKALLALMLTPEDLARSELDELARSGLAERDVKQFYVELTGIVRRYIERTTGIRAPEQTTEEFLREIHCAKVYSDEVNRRLKDFLEAADLVKFAAHRPRREDIDESFRRAERFVETISLPSPAGRGAGGEGSVGKAVNATGLCPSKNPHPSPLPKGEGTERQEVST